MVKYIQNILACWEPEVRLIGNVKASEIEELARFVITIINKKEV